MLRRLVRLMVGGFLLYVSISIIIDMHNLGATNTAYYRYVTEQYGLDHNTALWVVIGVFVFGVWMALKAVRRG